MKCPNFLLILSAPPLRGTRQQCAIHFLVGVNGSGKTQLLQALAEIFLALERLEFPPFPVTLVYDLGRQEESRTIYFYYPGPQNLRNNLDTRSALVRFKSTIPPDNQLDWSDLADVDWENEEALPYPVEDYYLRELPGSGSIDSYLPKSMLAYTSGATERWEQIFQRRRGLDEILAAGGEGLEFGGERPFGWNADRERLDCYFKGISRGLVEGNAEPGREGLEIGQVEEAGTSSLGVFIGPSDLKLSLAAVGLAQAVQDFAKAPDQTTETAYLAELAQQTNGLRGVLNRVNSLWPVTLVLRLNFDPILLRRLRPDIRANWRQLYQLATQVTGQTEGEEGQTYPDRYLYFDLRANQTRLENFPTNTAAALYQLLSTGVDRDDTPTPFKVFSKLRRWQQEGRLSEVNLLIRQRPLYQNRALLPDLLLYENLSDGERVLLGRMALFYLLQNTPDALLLLDEPENHFNDAWKRELVSLIDDALQETPNEVLITTHSSIALSDVFREEIHVLRRNSETGQTEASTVELPTFGADPGEIMVKIFDAPDSIGQRSLERLENLLTEDWSNRREELETYLRSVGFGYYRSELREIWRKLNAAQS